MIPIKPAAPAAFAMAVAMFAAFGSHQAGAAALPLAGDRPASSMAENADVRKRIWDSAISAPIQAALRLKPSFERNAWGSWSVRIDRNDEAVYVIVSPERDGAFPVYAQGSWIIKRSISDGSFIQAKVFLRSDPGTFIRLYPSGSRSRVDVVAYGGVFYRQAIVPLPFEELLKAPLSRLFELTSDVVDWSMFSPDPALYADLRTLVSKVRAGLPGLRYADDGAVDADGRAVFISSGLSQPDPAGLNCSGFAKWLVDGILKPVTGSYLSVNSLTERMTDFRGSSFTIKFEESSDPFFGLDWSRALARAAWGAFYPNRKALSPEADDVTETPFALRVRDADPINGGSAYEPFSDNFDDAGFDVKGLPATLFYLATAEPGRFYLAQFNASERDPPNLRRYFHIAALFPYFDEGGEFKVTVFESAAETTLGRLVADKDYEFVKLVRMPAAARFEPQPLGR